MLLRRRLNESLEHGGFEARPEAAVYIPFWIPIICVASFIPMPATDH